ncbi:MAG: tetratricopeptide repeat protein, partial [Bacteroidetes bacterium]
TRIKSGEQAVAYYQKTIELAPEWGLPYVNLCLEQFYNNDTEKAMETGEKALALMPDYPQLYNLLGWINANYGGAFRDKRSWTRRGVELSEDFRYDFDNQSSLWQLSAKFQKTIDLLEKAVEIDSTFTAAHYNLGPVYIQAVQYEKAVSHLKKAVLLDPENEYAFSRLGHALKLQAQFEASEEAYKKAIALARAHTPDQVPLHYNSLGLLYALWGNRDKAKNAYQKAIELNPNYGYPYGGIAHIYALEKDFEEAEGHCLKYVEVFASAPEAYLSAGNFYKSIDRYQDAEWMFLKAIEIYPDFTADRTPLTDLYQKTGDFAKALVWQEKRLEAAPDDPLPHLDAGKLAYLNKQKSQAKAYFDKAVELGVNFQGHLDITRFCLVHSEYDWAEYYAQLAQSIDPNWYILYELLAWIYYLENRPDEAQKVLDEGIVLQQPIHNKAHLNVTKALIYYFTGDGEKCMQYFQKAEAVDPTNIYFIGLGFMGERLKEKDYAAVDSCLTIYNARIGTRESLFINAVARAQLGHQEGGIEALKRSLEVRMPSNGISYDRVSKTPELEPLREAHAYQEMMRRHFPEKYDDLDTFEFTKPQPLYYPENCILLGEYYESQGEQKRAKFLFEKAIELKPDTPTTELAMRLAEVYLKQGKYEEAKAICPEELEPDDVEQLLSIGQLYYQLGRPDKAEAHFAAYVQKGSRSNRAQQVAWFYHEHGERGLTEQYLRKALDITPTFHGPYRGLGWLYFSYGDPENAIRLMDEGIRAFPSEFDLKGIKAMILALSDPSDQPGKAFAALEAERPDMAQIGTCLNLMRAKKYEEATAAYQTINKEIKDWWAPRMLKFAYVRMLIAKGDIDAAMDVIGRGDTWIFSYPLLYGDDTLAPLRETERFRAFVQRKFPEKAGKM